MVTYLKTDLNSIEEKEDDNYIEDINTLEISI